MNFICIAPFGNYVPGDEVVFPEGESPSPLFFVPSANPLPDPGPITPPVA